MDQGIGADVKALSAGSGDLSLNWMLTIVRKLLRRLYSDHSKAQAHFHLRQLRSDSLLQLSLPFRQG